MIKNECFSTRDLEVFKVPQTGESLSTKMDTFIRGLSANVSVLPTFQSVFAFELMTEDPNNARKM